MLTKQEVRGELAMFPLHLTVATIGVLVVDVVLVIVFDGALSFLPIQFPDFGTAYSPLYWLPALIIGFFVNRATANRSACLVGGLAIVVLFVLLRWDVSSLSKSEYYAKLTGGHYWRYEFQQLLSPSDNTCGSGECLEKLFFTVPTVAAVAYSVGAWFGLKYKRPHSNSQKPVGV